MLFNKNLPVWERALRSIAGLLMIAFGLLAPGLTGNPIGYIIAAGGALAILTGFVGYCPACAVVGRRLK